MGETDRQTDRQTDRGDRENRGGDRVERQRDKQRGKEERVRQRQWEGQGVASVLVDAHTRDEDRRRSPTQLNRTVCSLGWSGGGRGEPGGARDHPRAEPRFDRPN